MPSTLHGQTHTHTRVNTHSYCFKSPLFCYTFFYQVPQIMKNQTKAACEKTSALLLDTRFPKNVRTSSLRHDESQLRTQSHTPTDSSLSSFTDASDAWDGLMVWRITECMRLICEKFAKSENKEDEKVSQLAC